MSLGSAIYSAALNLFRKLDRTLLARFSPGSASIVRAGLIGIGHLLFPRRVPAPTAKLMSELRRARWKGAPLPDWAIAEMRVQATFEPTLFPSRTLLTEMEFLRIPHNHEAPGRIFSRILRDIRAGGPADHVIFVPWLKVGGADRATLVHARAMQEHLRRKVIVVSTSVGASPWADRLPDGCRFMAIGEHLASLEIPDQSRVIARLVLQLKPSSVHVINSMEAWRTLRTHGLALRQVTNLFASAYCDDVTSEGQLMSAARLHAREAAAHLSRIFTDCRSYARELIEYSGIDSSKVSVLYLPVEPAAKTRSRSAPTEAGRILWASRLDRQKRPDILAAIAAANPGWKFDVFGTSVIAADDQAMRKLRKLPNVSLHGSYESFDALPWQEAAVFLYTSQWDGLPNVVLEAAVRGMQIVAPAIGGIEELLQGDPTALVGSPDDVSGYTKLLGAALRANSGERRVVRPYTHLVASRHSWSKFLKDCEHWFAASNNGGGG